MHTTTLTMKLHIHVDKDIAPLFCEMTEQYRLACNFVSQYIFDSGETNLTKIHEALYLDIRANFNLKSQLAISAARTVVARYGTIKEQLEKKPFKYKDENGDWQYITRTLEWLWKPVFFSCPQADLVRNRDYSFVDGGKSLSINTLGKRVKVSFDVPANFEKYFDGSWKFGTAKLVSLNDDWYLHIPMTKEESDELDISMPKHVVGIDRGLRFLCTTYNEKSKVNFFSGKEVLDKRATFNSVRAKLQSKGTKSAKRVLKRMSGRENRWMTDVNHRLSKTLVDMYGKNTMFVLEDLTNVSFSEETLNNKNKDGRNELRSWTFYQLEQFLEYKAKANSSDVVKVSANYTSQRCPKCGRIHKENRHHDTHEYICDSCGYRSNDDRIGAMNIYTLGTMYVSGDTNPRFGVRKAK